MHNKIIVWIVLIFVLALAGCKSSQNTNPITDIEIRKGTEGLTMEFLEFMPEKVFEEDIFEVGLNLKNKGAYDITDGRLFFGFETQYVDADSAKKEKIFSIKGKSILNPEGNSEYLTINARAKNIGSSETHTSTILATACYPYSTKADVSVCIDASPNAARRQKPCEMKVLEFSEGQGAPVAVTKIETKILPQENEKMIRPQFVIYMENKGEGRIIKANKISNACSSEALAPRDFGAVLVKASLSGNELECSKTDKLEQNEYAEILLKENAEEGENRMVCKSKEGISKNEDAFTAPLTIYTNYGYTFTTSKEIIIEKAD
ncbi:hypothetical protein HYX01_02140 [Candidatus Woesearchaeota archaeon]|nr:hypothetical protein [Candidatus Woesearchaeota archaeon]